MLRPLTQPESIFNLFQKQSSPPSISDSQLSSVDSAKMCALFDKKTERKTANNHESKKQISTKGSARVISRNSKNLFPGKTN
mmetsp:Transcript_3428/g.4226  ORF Transcript_3428/g.4226 Transcript_3428/m.4226 type:complete len:82 (+) Transcript_3428:685-930(+)